MSTVLQVLINSSFQLQQAIAEPKGYEVHLTCNHFVIFLGIGSRGHYTCATKTLILLWKRETIPVLLKPSKTITQCSYHPRVLPGFGSMASLLLLAFLCKECWDPAIFLSNGTLVFNLLGRTMQNFNARNWEPSNPVVYMFFLACLVSSGQYYNHSLLTCTSWDGIPILSSKYIHVHSHHCYPNECHVHKWCFNPFQEMRTCTWTSEIQLCTYTGQFFEVPNKLWTSQLHPV